MRILFSTLASLLFSISVFAGHIGLGLSAGIGTAFIKDGNDHDGPIFAAPEISYTAKHLCIRTVAEAMLENYRCVGLQADYAPFPARFTKPYFGLSVTKNWATVNSWHTYAIEGEGFAFGLHAGFTGAGNKRVKGFGELCFKKGSLRSGGEQLGYGSGSNSSLYIQPDTDTRFSFLSFKAGFRVLFGKLKTAK